MSLMVHTQKYTLNDEILFVQSTSPWSEKQNSISIFYCAYIPWTEIIGGSLFIFIESNYKYNRVIKIFLKQE